MPLTWKDRIKVSIASGGTGTLTLNAAASGYQTFAAGDDAKLFPYVIENGTAWETGFGTYTHSGTTFARTARTDSSSGSAIDAGTGYLYVDLISTNGANLTGALQTYISGLVVTKNSGGNTLDISAGSCYDPSSSKLITYAGATGVSAGTLGASQWNQVYIYDNAGTATIEVSNNANPPSTTYAGTARQGGTNSNRRWIGTFLTNASSNIRLWDVKESGANAMLTTFTDVSATSPYRILNGVTTPVGSWSSEQSLVGCIPRYVATEFIAQMPISTTSGASTVLLGLSIDGANPCVGAGTYVEAGKYPQITVWCSIRPSTPGFYYQIYSGTNPSIYLDVDAYKWVR